MEENEVMQPLTEEQKEYVDLKQAMDSMREYYLNQRSAHLFLSCQPKQSTIHNSKFLIEGQFYLFMECLQGKHNDFLQDIIDKTKTKS